MIDSGVSSDTPSGVSETCFESVCLALEGGDRAALRAFFADLHPADQASVIADMPQSLRQALLRMGLSLIAPETFSYLESQVREELFTQLPPRVLSSIVSRLDSDDAVDLIEELDAQDRDAILQGVRPGTRIFLEDSLTFLEDTAGRLMRREAVTMPAKWTVARAFDYLRQHRMTLPETFYVIFLIDPGYRVVGEVPLSQIIRGDQSEFLEQIASTSRLFAPETKTDEIARVFRKYGLSEVGVVNDSGRLLGVVTVDDVLEASETISEEETLHLSGLSANDFYTNLLGTVKARFGWLFVNLLTAILASVTIFFFEATIEQIVALATLLPITASMGGNAGVQTLAVTVRAISTGTLSSRTVGRLIIKELGVGIANGISFAVITGALTWLWLSDVFAGLVIAVAMIINLVAAGSFGTLIPIFLDKMKIDPAVGSAVILTTITDILGFGVFLGAATLILL